MSLLNQTFFAPLLLPGTSPSGVDQIIVVVAARFALPPGGQVWTNPLEPAPEQLPPPVSDEYLGAAADSTLLREAQTVYRRPGTDVYLTGHAVTLGERPKISMMTELRVGPLRKQALVVGDRRWRKGVPRGTKSFDPAPFTRMPLTYERTFGGRSLSAQARSTRLPAAVLQSARCNPVGCGLFVSDKEAEGQPVPNIMPPQFARLRRTDYVQPVGFAPICRSWPERLAYAGTYDERWRRQRAPHWPTDFDERHFIAAAQGLHARDGLRGGEPVVLRGFCRAGDMSFSLPRIALVAELQVLGKTAVAELRLDAVHVEPDDQTVTLVHRCSFPATMSDYRGGLVRMATARERAHSPKPMQRHCA